MTDIFKYDTFSGVIGHSELMKISQSMFDLIGRSTGPPVTYQHLLEHASTIVQVSETSRSHSLTIPVLSVWMQTRTEWLHDRNSWMHALMMNQCVDPLNHSTLGSSPSIQDISIHSPLLVFPYLDSRWTLPSHCSLSPSSTFDCIFFYICRLSSFPMISRPSKDDLSFFFPSQIRRSVEKWPPFFSPAGHQFPSLLSLCVWPSLENIRIANISLNLDERQTKDKWEREWEDRKGGIIHGQVKSNPHLNDFTYQ